MLDVNWNPGRRELRQFAIGLLIFGLVLGGLTYYRSGEWGVPTAIAAVAALIAALGLLNANLIRPLFVAWMAAAYPIGWTVSQVVLALTFYLVVTPIGLFMRAIGRDPLGRRVHRSPESYWVAHEPSRDPASYFKQS